MLCTLVGVAFVIAIVFGVVWWIHRGKAIKLHDAIERRRQDMEGEREGDANLTEGEDEIPPL